MASTLTPTPVSRYSPGSALARQVDKSDEMQTLSAAFSWTASNTRASASTNTKRHAANRSGCEFIFAASSMSLFPASVRTPTSRFSSCSLPELLTRLKTPEVFSGLEEYLLGITPPFHFLANKPHRVFLNSTDRSQFSVIANPLAITRRPLPYLCVQLVVPSGVVPLREVQHSLVT